WRPMRSRKWRVSSSLENSRARSPAASAAMVRRCRGVVMRPASGDRRSYGVRRSLDDPGHQVEPRLDAGGDALEAVALIALGHGILPQGLDHVERMRHRVDRARIDAIHLLDELQD